MEFTVGCGERLANVYGVVHVLPPQAEHFFSSQPEPERQVDGGVPRVDSADGLEDRAREGGVDHREGRRRPGRSMYERARRPGPDR